MKLLKVSTIVLLAFILFLGAITPTAFASTGSEVLTEEIVDESVDTPVVIDESSEDETNTEYNDELSYGLPVNNGNVKENDNPERGINSFRYRKKNVKVTYQWSPYKRISANLNTYNSNGGSITANKQVTIGTSVSGTATGIGLNLNKSVTSQKSYTLNVPKNKRVYLGYRARLRVETGTREYYDTINGKVRSSNKYTVKQPTVGEYKLVNY